MFISYPLCAHEFWIDPVEFQVSSGENIEAHLKLGSNFRGGKHGFLAPRTVRHDIAANGTIQPLPARSGDRPAIQVQNPPDGLITLIHETTDETLTYKEWAKFLAFAEHKDFMWVQDAHKARGLPDVEFGESYRRHIKSLVAVGDGAGQDVRAGMVIEIVALSNPFTDDLQNGFQVQVWLNDEPVVDGQVELFEQPPEGEVAITLHRTGTDGTVFLPVKAGHTYMVDHVALWAVEPTKDNRNSVWHSAWANLTFQVPN